MNKGAKDISCTYLVKNNVVPSVKEVTNSPSMVHATSPQPRRGCHLGFHACKPCHQSKGGTSRRIRGRHVDVTWIEGPTGTKTASKSSGHQELTWGPTGQPPGESTPRGGLQGVGRPHRSAEPTLWPPLRGFHVVVLVGPSLHLGGVCSHSTLVIRPINRRRGGSFLSNSLCNPSLTFGFQG
jgi:hypothetical protein